MNQNSKLKFDVMNFQSHGLVNYNTALHNISANTMLLKTTEQTISIHRNLMQVDDSKSTLAL